MQSNLIISVIAILSFLSCFSGLIFLKKTEKSINLVISLPLQFILLYAAVAFACGIINLLLPVNLITVSIVCILMAAALWLLVYKNGRQRYSFRFIDAIAFLILIAIAGYYAYKQFGGALLPVYETSDPATHLKMAMNVVSSQRLTTMFFAPLFNAITIELFGFLVNSSIYYYKIFVLTDIAMYALSALLFYSLLASRAERIRYKLCAGFVTIVYMLGYPLNNMVFGFVYLGIGVSVIIALMHLSECYISGAYNHTLCVVALMLMLFAIAVCYSLFAPIAYFALLFVGVIKYFKQKRLFSWEFVFEQLKIFLLPSILAVYYLAFTGAGELTEAATLTIEGYIYRDLYSNFILLLPIAIFALYKSFKNKKTEYSSAIFIILILSVVVLLYLGLKGHISSYYYYKLYYPLWAVCLYMVFLAIKEIEEKNFALVVSSITAVSLAFIVAITGVNEKIQNINILFNPNSCAYELFDIYDFNSQKIIKDNNIEERGEWLQRIELYDYVENNNLKADDKVQLVDEWLYVFWYEALTNQRFEQYYWEAPEATMQSIKSAEYVVVNPRSEMYEQNKDYFDSLERVFENSLGFVARI